MTDTTTGSARKMSIDRLDRAAATYEQTAKPFLITIFMILALMPFYLQLGPLRMTPIRFFLLIAFIPLVFRWISGRYGGILLPDILLAAHGLWMFIAMVMTEGFSASVEFLGTQVMEMFGPYLLARTYIRDLPSFVYFVKVLLIAIIVLIPFALVENITNKMPVSMVFDALPGFSTLIKEQNDMRMSLFRAQVTFPHPISWGVFCATIFALAWFVPLANGASTASRVFWSGVTAVGSFLSLSSGAILSVGIQCGLIGWHVATQWLKARWLILGGGFLVFYILIDLISNRTAIEVFLSYLTFSSHNAYFRIEIFNYGWKEVSEFPIFGIGQREFRRPWWMHSASVDNFWLLTAMRYGIPGTLLMIGGFLVGVFKVGLMDFSKRPDLAACQRGYVIAMVGLFFSLTTVHLWASAFAFIFLLFGSGIWLYSSDQALDLEEPSDSEKAESPRRGGPERTHLPERTLRAERTRGVERTVAREREEVPEAMRNRQETDASRNRFTRGDVKPTPKR